MHYKCLLACYDIDCFKKSPERCVLIAVAGQQKFIFRCTDEMPGRSSRENVLEHWVQTTFLFQDFQSFCDA